jgi:hypothetical protein
MTFYQNQKQIPSDMRNYFLFILFFSLTINTNSQSPYDNDGISHRDFSILKTDSVPICVLKTRLSGLTKPEVAKKLYGNNHTTLKHFDELFGERFTQIKYPDGLELTFYDKYNHLFTFVITSDKYTMLLSTGQKIKIGMTGDELKAVFPKSYSQKTIIINSGAMSGKTSFIVYFTIPRDNKIIYADEWITFILGEKDGRLEKFFSYVPG